MRMRISNRWQLVVLAVGAGWLTGCANVKSYISDASTNVKRYSIESYRGHIPIPDQRHFESAD